jgi:hypothetical protein
MTLVELKKSIHDKIEDLNDPAFLELINTLLQKKETNSFINDDQVIPGDSTINISELHSIFTGLGLDAAELRNSGWQRKR